MVAQGGLLPKPRWSRGCGMELTRRRPAPAGLCRARESRNDRIEPQIMRINADIIRISVDYLGFVLIQEN